MNIVSKKNTYIFLAFCFILGLGLRFIYLDRITFGYDQARDALQALDIWINDPIKIIGPTTDIKGLFHGPLYWYLISPFYFFTHNPLTVRIFLIIISMGGVFFAFFLAKKLFNNTLIAYSASFLYAISFEAIGYSRWLSNPVPALLTIPLFFYGFWLSLNKKKIGFPLMLLGWVLSIQFQFFLNYLILFLIIGLVKQYGKNIWKIAEVSKREIILYLLSAFFISSFVLAEIQFKLQGFKALFGFFQKKETSDTVFQLRISEFIHDLIKTISYNITAQWQSLSLLCLLLIFGYVAYNIYTDTKYKKPLLFLFIWLISPALIYPFEKNNSYFLNIGILYPLLLITSVFIYEFARKFQQGRSPIMIILLGVIFLGNASLIMRYNKNGDVLFSVQKNLLLEDEKKVLNYVYTDSHRREFYINTVTNPLFINTTWSYLFDWYGKSTYGYMPVWYGYPQDGVYGSTVQFAQPADQVGKTLYLLIEPGLGIPQEYIKGYIIFENMRSKKVSEKKIGTFTIEKRIIQNNQYFSRDELYAIVKK